MTPAACFWPSIDTVIYCPRFPPNAENALAVLFEYAATLGLIDVAYVLPQLARNDFYDRWGSDDLSCLSRYDGLRWLRINKLGAWVLGVADKFELEPIVSPPVFKLLPNLELVAGNALPNPADILFLDRFAQRQSPAVWQLTRDKVLQAIEAGLKVAELRELLSARTEGPLPQTVEVFLADIENKAGQIEDLGDARLIACQDPVIARMLISDRRLSSLCQLAGERCLVFKSSDESAFRRRLRELGFVLPASGDGRA